MRRGDDLIFETYPKWRRLLLTVVEFVCVLAVIFLLIYVDHIVRGIG